LEYKTNAEVAQKKIAKNRSDDRRELLLGIMVWPGLFDLKNADGNEANALLDRNIYLRELAKNKSCPEVEAWPEQPARYTMIDPVGVGSNTHLEHVTLIGGDRS
jgi:hypothetical protein